MSDFIPTPERQRQILSLLTQQGRLSVTEIVKQFSISEATARRDLESLASQGKAQRVHGGVIAVEQALTEISVDKVLMGTRGVSIVSLKPLTECNSGLYSIYDREMMDQKEHLMTEETPTTDRSQKDLAGGETLVAAGKRWGIVYAKSGTLTDDETAYPDDPNAPQTPGAVRAPRNLPPPPVDAKG